MIVKIPDSWDEISIRTLQELFSVGDNIIERIAILSDTDPEEVKKWDIASIQRVGNALAWTNELPKQKDIKSNISINGKEYSFSKKLSSLNGGEWLDLEHFIKEPIMDLHKVMALFYGCEQEEAKDIKISDAYSCLLFFSTIEKESYQSIQAYLMTEEYLMKLKNLKIIDSHGSGSFMEWLKATQYKWRKSLI